MIKLQNSQFSPCSVGWDSEKNRFRKNTKDEVYVCCDKKCDEYRRACGGACDLITKDAGDCHFSCNIMGNVCDKICESARFDWDQKIFDPCLKSSGCLKGEILNERCLIDKKEELMKCCLSNCVPEEDLNCEQHCGISYDINLERSGRGKMPESVAGERTNPPKENKKRDGLYIYLAAASALLIIFFAAVLRTK